MRKQLLLVAGLFFVVSSMQAQEKTKLKPAFHSIEQVALINGNDAVSGALQTINGVSYGKWFAGIGAGLDFYRYRSVPLFIDLRRFFDLNKGNKLFVYADGGYNLPWVKNQEPQYSIWSWPANWEIKYKYNGGAYTDAGIGYAVYFRNGYALLLSTGYSYKYFRERRTTITATGENNRDINVQKFTYSMNRIMVKAGIQF